MNGQLQPSIFKSKSSVYIRLLGVEWMHKMQTLLNSTDLRSLTKARGLLVFKFSSSNYGLLSNRYTSKFQQLSTKVLLYSKRQCQSLISLENWARIIRILDYARRRSLSNYTCRHAAYRQNQILAIKNIAHFNKKNSMRTWPIGILSQYMCSTHRRPHTIEYFNVYSRQMAIDH